MLIYPVTITLLSVYIFFQIKTYLISGSSLTNHLGCVNDQNARQR